MAKEKFASYVVESRVKGGEWHKHAIKHPTRQSAAARIKWAKRDADFEGLVFFGPKSNAHKLIEYRIVGSYFPPDNLKKLNIRYD